MKLRERLDSLLHGRFKILLLFFSVFGPATITAMADNDAAGVATYSLSGAKLGYPILFPLALITLLLGITQEMGMRLTVATNRGLADLIREKYGVKAAFFIFASLLIANLGTIVSDLNVIKAVAPMIGLPAIPTVILMLLVIFIFVTRGNYKLTQNIMLLASLFYICYIISAVKSQPDWGLALGNLIYPHGVNFTPAYWKEYLIIGMGVLGTTITPWGQFFVSSFAYDKKIDPDKIGYAVAETYWGAFLTDFFSFFMIIATAATLFSHGIALESGEQAALAIKPFAGEMASFLFALGMLNAGFMGVVIVSLSTSYAFAEFFGISGSLDSSFKQSRTFYTLFAGQLLLAGIIVLFLRISMFQMAIASQALNAMILPLVFFYLIRLTSNKALMKKHVNSKFKKYFAIVCTIVIIIASIFTLGSGLMSIF